MGKEVKVPWDGWEIVRYIDSGSYGSVYEIQRETYGYIDKAAMKVISIPHSSSEVRSMLQDGSSREGVKRQLLESRDKVLNEYKLMREMNGSANVVNCDDIQYVPHEDGMGWDIYIRMELLTPLADSLSKTISEETVIKIAKDLSKALILCKNYKIIHRDIKPSNIFVSRHGDYKLGDFGIAKTIEQTKGGTVTGTYEYMAPEVKKDQPYGSAADIYSLGLVLYWLLNERRLPFLPLPPKDITLAEKEEAKNRRFNGEALPAPKNGSKWLKNIVLKACAYNPEDRFTSAEEMLRCIENQICVDYETVYTPVNGEEKTVNADTHRSDDGGTIRVDVVVPPEPPKPPIKKIIAIAAAAAIVLAGGLYMLLSKNDAGTGQPPAVSPVADTGTVQSATVSSDDSKYFENKSEKIVDLAAGISHVVYLNGDGTVVAKGSNSEGQCDVENWSDIIAVDAGVYTTVGLKSDGTVVAIGQNEYGECNVDDWTDIIDISATWQATVGLKSNGTVVATGNNIMHNLDVRAWTDIKKICAEKGHTVAIKEDGTVVAAGYNGQGQCEVYDWANIVDIDAGWHHTVGLKSDGTVVATGQNDLGQCDVGDWTNIVAVVADDNITIGLCKDGSIVYTGDNRFMLDVPSWKDIKALDVIAGGSAIGLKSNGDLVFSGIH